MDEKTRERLTKLAEEAGESLQGLEVCIKTTIIHMALDFAGLHTGGDLNLKPVALTLHLPASTAEAIERIRAELDTTLADAVFESAILSAMNEGLKSIAKALILDNDPVALSILGDDVSIRFQSIDKARASFSN